MILFTCCVFRAIHLEIIESMSTESFILGLRRLYPLEVSDHEAKNLQKTFQNLKIK